MPGRGHMAHSCPLGKISKPIAIDDHDMLRKDGDGTSMVAIAKHPATHTGKGDTWHIHVP